MPVVRNICQIPLRRVLSFYMSGELRQRGSKKAKAVASHVANDEKEDLLKESVSSPPKDSDFHHYCAMTFITVIGAFIRFIKLGTPDTVVFDEVHFGKFASYYLEGTYFFDLHPPFAKLLIAFVGWLWGFDGNFKFDAIGDPYAGKDAPYVALRALLAIQGTAVIPLIYMTMKTLDFSVPACFFASMLVCFDNAHVIDSRLILLDSTLLLSVAATVFCYVKFSTYRRKPFCNCWWSWLMATGVSLSCVISTKYVGVFTYVMIGMGVLHELWILLDYRRGHPMELISKHFLARLWALIIIPFCIYLYWFHLHFSILTASGPGDAFMSFQFQESLEESPLTKSSRPVQFGDELTLKHRNTGGFLHSHNYTYPLRYPDGRVSSAKQQVTSVQLNETEAAEDWNSIWQVVPTKDHPLLLGLHTQMPLRLKHKASGGYLLAHDVASPLRATNEEFTVVFGKEAAKRYNETIFVLKSEDPQKVEQVRNKTPYFSVIHRDTNVAMWSQNTQPLPDWAFHQGEISGNKKLTGTDNHWTFDNIVSLKPEDPRNLVEPKVPEKINFLKKWWELQGKMFKHNNMLSSEHPFASQPDAWPLSLSGVSFWNNNDTRMQIYFIGNIVGFWIEALLILMYVAWIIIDQLTERRNVHLLDARARSRLYNTLGFFFIGWSAHYFPFFLMNRQKFLHHYLPAHLIAALLSGGMIEFLVYHSPSLITSRSLKLLTPTARIYFMVGASTVAVIWFFWFFRALTYGDITMTVDQFKARQWLNVLLQYAN